MAISRYESFPLHEFSVVYLSFFLLQTSVNKLDEGYEAKVKKQGMNADGEESTKDRLLCF